MGPISSMSSSLFFEAFFSWTIRQFLSAPPFWSYRFLSHNVILADFFEEVLHKKRQEKLLKMLGVCTISFNYLTQKHLSYLCFSSERTEGSIS